MSLSLALSNALTGLRANSTQADIIANNVANAQTEGYGRRNVALSPAAIGGAGAGVRVDGIVRAASPVTTEARRIADAASGGADVLSTGLSRLADAVGEPGVPGSLASAGDRLDTALSAAADTPESTARLADVSAAANAYASSINRVASEAAAVRTQADRSIALQVDTVNNALNAIKTLNGEITQRTLAGADTSALNDQRGLLIDQVSSIIPVKTIRRDNDAVALFTPKGGQLLDGSVFPLGFEPARIVTPEQTVGNGALSGITLAGRDVPTGVGDDLGFLDGGTLGATFALRDVTVPEFTTSLDGMAADLITRVQSLPADTTLAPTDPGLFTDAGLAFDPVNTVGISTRIAVSAQIDQAQGGALTNLRDGLNAVAVGDAGNASILRGLQDALSQPLAPLAGSGLTGQRGSAGFAAEISATLLTSRSRAEEDAVFRAARADVLSEAETADTAVDTDQELSRLLVVEQSYAANARVIEVIDSLLARLLQI
ncbi:MAG: flagellar hook-associated protein FlgK [Pseudomonadota bacterium]